MHENSAIFKQAFEELIERILPGGLCLAHAHNGNTIPSVSVWDTTKVFRATSAMFRNAPCWFLSCSRASRPCVTKWAKACFPMTQDIFGQSSGTRESRSRPVSEARALARARSETSHDR